MQAISPELQDILKSRLQAGGRGFNARVSLITEVTTVASCPTITSEIIASAFTSGESFDTAPPATFQAPTADYDALLYMIGGYRGSAGGFIGANLDLLGDWNEIEMENNDPYESAHDMFVAGWAHVGAGETPPIWEIAMTGNAPQVWGVVGVRVPSVGTTIIQTSTNPTAANTPVLFDTPPQAGNVLIGLVGGSNTNDGGLGDTVDWTLILPQLYDNGSIGTAFVGVYYHCVTEAEEALGKVSYGNLGSAFGSAGWSVAFECLGTQTGLHESEQKRPRRVSIDKSLRLVADTAEVEFENEELDLGWGEDNGEVKTNQRVAIDQWYGDESNAIRTFTGIIDRVSNHRDVLTQTWTMRDMMGILVDETFSASGPQGADEEGAIRTEDNGVYLNREIDYIVSDLLDRVGWPEDDRAITPTSYVLDEFIVSDGASYADTIIGDTQLTGLVGYSAWADELGVFHFAPTLVSQNLTNPMELDYTFRAGEDITALDDQTDQYDLVTRIKARGPLTTTTLTDTWRELWRTSKFHLPVGLWYDPSDSANIRVLDRGTKRLYKLRQSDRAVLSSVYLGGTAPYPLGLSGDPSDPSIYWVLNAPWRFGGPLSGNSVKKYRKSDNALLHTYSIPSGRWSAVKVSANFVWLTNLDTDRFYKRSKSTLAGIASYQHVYNSSTQANPSGLMIDGTTLSLFWANGGTTARFLVCDESAPTTITKVVKTAGTTLHGGEMDTTTHTECWGDSDSLGLVAKFTLVAAVDQTSEVFAEVVNSDLEDELGQLALLEPRTHDTHPGDGAHRWEARRATLDLEVITSLAQATETAQRQLDISSQRRRVVDAGILGQPAVQKTDYVAIVDPVTDTSTGYAVDTYRTEMEANNTYLGTLSLLPVEEVEDEPEEEPDSVPGSGS